MINGVKYCNDGDWVDSLSALVETMDGELKLIRWAQTAVKEQKEHPQIANVKPMPVFQSPITQPQLEPAAAE